MFAYVSVNLAIKTAHNIINNFYRYILCFNNTLIEMIAFRCVFLVLLYM